MGLYAQFRHRWNPLDTAAKLSPRSKVQERGATTVPETELERLRAALDKLSEPVRQMLVERYGLDGRAPRELGTLGGGLVTGEAVRQRLVKAVKRLKFQIQIQGEK